MRLRLLITVLSLTLAAAAAFAAAPVETLLAPAPDADDALTVLDKSAAGLRLEYALSRLDAEKIDIDGAPYSRLDIPGASLQGETGRPALPVLGALLAVPEGLGVSVRVIEMETRELAVGRVMPALPVEGEAPVVDEAAYAKDLSKMSPGAEIAAPGVMRDLRVAPLTVRPVAYDPAGGRLTVAVRMVIEVTFSADGKGADVPGPEPRDTIAASFDAFYRANILNYDAAAKSVDADPGTYLMICSSSTAVTTRVEPLLEWRRRQGYNVLLATTAETGTTTSSIKAYIQTMYDTTKPPLEFVTLVGDVSGSWAIPTYTESLSGYNGRGDHTYTTLDGSDVLPDVHLGRLSFQDDDIDNLDEIIAKIVGYETTPAVGGTDPEWFTRGSLVGDPYTDSGITPVYINQWVRDLLLDHHYTEIDSLWAPNASSMMAQYNRGATLMTYRGWYGMSGMQASYIDNLSNGDKLSFAVIMTCDTGSIQDDMCRSEAFLRASNGGGVASIGTATTGTHTRYNNCMFSGVIDGAYNLDDYRVGPALTNGKLAMYDNYFLSEPSNVEVWMIWNSLIGDPATEIWTAFPGGLVVAYDATLDEGAESVFAEVTDGTSGLPVAGAAVTLYKSDEIRFTAITDAAGRVNIPISGYTQGDLLITARKHNYVPYRGTIVIGPISDLVTLSGQAIDDTDWGNSDGKLNPGEHIQVAVQLENLGAATAPGVSAVLSSSEPWVTILTDTSNFNDIGAGTTDWGNTMFEIALSDDAPAEHFLHFDLTITSGTETWHALLAIEIFGGSFAPLGYSFAGGDLDPGESGDLSVNLRNTGNIAIAGATATLICGSPWISVSDADGTYTAMNANTAQENTSDPFTISIDSGCFQGHLANFRVALLTAEGVRDTIEFSTQVGTASSTDPVGPDAYGYHVFDDTDTGYGFAPVYDWTEIAPDLGGSGTDLGLTDDSYEEDDVTTVVLPFDFVYYGLSYDRISVCSNGWLAMGTTTLRNYRNWSLPTAGAPDAMICGFWDNLYDAGAGGVYWWHDEAQNRVIVEWSRMRNHEGGGYETFQIILYDPESHTTDTGDGIIEMMYNAVSQVDGTNGYSTVGLQNHDHTDGLVYTYWNQYPDAAATLTSGRALRFQTFAAVPVGRLEGTVTNASAGTAALEGATITVIGAGRTFHSASDGSYDGSVSPGTYDVVASHPSFAADTTYAVTISEDATTTVDFALVDTAGPEFTGTSVLTNTSDTTGPYTVQTTVTDHTGLASVGFRYLTSAGGALVEVTPTDLGGGIYQAQIPGQPLDTRIRYFFSAEDVLEQYACDPIEAPAATYAFRVDDSFAYVTDMETSDGWTVGGSGDNATSGIWTRADPVYVEDEGIVVQPDDDHSDDGTLCYITGNAETGAQGADDVDYGQTTLYSPVFDVDGFANLTFSYWRWFCNDTGNNPGEDEWVVQVTDGSGWVDIERTTTSDHSWVQVTYPLSTFVSATSTVQFRFVADDEGAGGSVVEAGVDDFMLYNDLSTFDTEDPEVTVVAPLPDAVFVGDIMPALEWTATDDTGVTYVQAWYSADGGATWPYLVDEGALTSPSAGDFDGVPDSDMAMIKIICFDAELNMGSDDTDGVFTLDTITGVEDGDLPARIGLAQNHPNPFNPATEISFSLPTKQTVTLKVYDVAGREVATLARGVHTAGPHTVMWRGQDDHGARVASGLYFYRLRTQDGTETRKMTLLK